MRQTVAWLMLSALCGPLAVPTAEAAFLTAFDPLPYLPETLTPKSTEPAPSELTEHLAGQSMVDPFTGAAALSIPLRLPPGLRGQTPALALDYSSHRAEAPSPFGYDWRLPLGRIERRRVPGRSHLYDGDHFRIETPQFQDDLVLISQSPDRQVYGLSRESAFPRITRELAGDVWTVTTTDGTASVFGPAAPSREQDATSGRVFAWNLDHAIDLHGNRIDYRYARIGNVLYPRSVAYGGRTSEAHPFEVVFEPFDQPGPESNRDAVRVDYSAGFPRAYEHRVSAISVRIQGAERLRYALAYGSGTVLDTSQLVALQIQSPAAFNTPPQTLRFEYFRTADAPGHALRMLKRVTLPQGGTYDFTYVTANSVQREGALLNARPHVPIAVVAGVTAADFTGRSDTTRYEYAQGHYYYESAVERQLAGFGQVRVTDPLDGVTEHFFHQGRGLPPQRFREEDSRSLIGRPYRVVRSDPLSGQTRTEFRRWRATELQPERFFVRQDLAVVTHDDGLTSHSTAVASSYDPTFGTLTEQTEYGRIELTPSGFTDVSDDARRRVYGYAHNDDRHLHALPATEALYDHAGTLLAATASVYDELPVGEAEIGDRTERREQLIEEERALATRFEYFANGQVRTVTTPRDGVYAVSYEPLGIYPATVANPLGHVTRYEYDLLTGEATSVTDPNGQTTTAELDGLGRVVTRRQTDPASGDQLQLRERLEYRESSLPHSVATFTYVTPQSTATSIAYRDGFGRTIQTRSQHADGPDAFVVASTRHDALGRAIASTLPTVAAGAAYDEAGASPIVTTTLYDAFDRVTSVADANGTTVASYPGAGQQKHVRNAKGQTREFAYDGLGRLVRVVEHAGVERYDTIYRYDARDLPVGMTDAQGNVRAFEYDSLGRLRRSEELHDPGASSVAARIFRYDDEGNVTYSGPPMGKWIEATYDPLNRVERKTHMAFGHSPIEYEFTYDQGPFGLGRLGSVQGPAALWSADYDRRGRVTRESLVIGGDPEVSGDFDDDGNVDGSDFLQWQRGVGTGYNGDHLNAWKAGFGQQPAAAGLAEREFVKETTYTLFDKPQRIDYPDGTWIENSYNSIGQLVAIASSTGPVATALQYSPQQQVRRIDYANGVASAMDYDPQQMDRLAAKRTTREGQSIQDLAYAYDPIGNIEQLVESASTAANRDAEYVYDDLNRLRSARIDTPGGLYQQEYAHDAVGNIISMGGVGVFSYAQTPNAHPHAVTTIDDAARGRTELRYDATGNLAERQAPDERLLLSWHGRDELIRSTSIRGDETVTVDYLYSDDGRRLRKQTTEHRQEPCIIPVRGLPHVSSSDAFWDSDHVSSGASDHVSSLPNCEPSLVSDETTLYPFVDYEVTAAGTTKVTVQADDWHVATIESESQPGCPSSDHAGCLESAVYFHHDDHLGGSNIVTDESGALVQTLDYFPFGSVRIDEQSAGYDATQKYTGHELDDETDLYYAQARYYGAGMGRFTVIDPLQRRPTELLQLYGENPQGLNAYSYALNNPLVLIDPTGEFAIAAVPLWQIAVATSFAAWATVQFDQTIDAVGSIAGDTARRIADTLSIGSGPSSGNKPPDRNSKENPPVPPSLKDEKEQRARTTIDNITNDLNRPQDATNRVGDGSTAAAVRHELETGELVGGKSHLIKAMNSIRGLRNHTRTLQPADQAFNPFNRPWLEKGFRELHKLHDVMSK